MFFVLARLAAATLLFAGLVALRLDGDYPALPASLSVELSLEAHADPVAGRADPILVSGRSGAADFLVLRFLDARSAEFVYDSWGFPATRSAPVALRPGQPLRLRLTVPALDQVAGTWTAETGRLRVECDDRVVLDTSVHHFARERDELWFGENPLGGTACDDTLRGRLVRADGRELRGPVARLFTPADRVRDWGRRTPWEPVALAAFAAAFVWLIPVAARRLRALPLRAVLGLAATHRWFLLPAAGCLLAFAWMLTFGTFRLHHREVFGSFYDYQAASLLRGRLDVPDVAIGGEAFVARGKLYGYFGPTPTLLRLPFAVTGFAFGHLSRGVMLAAYAAALLAAYLILRDARRLLAGPAPGGSAAVFSGGGAAVLLTAGLGLGSTAFFLGSRAVLFHEAILVGIALALWSARYSLRFLQAPAGRAWIGALVCGLLSAHARPPTGLFALTLLGVVACLPAIRALPARRRPADLRRPLVVGSLCLLAFFSVNALAWLKFRTFDPAPLRLSRPYDAVRLASIDGRSFHLVNVPANATTYFLWPNLRVEPGFPWVYLGSSVPPPEFPRAKLDLPDTTLALPWAMPGLVGAALLGSLVVLAARPGLRWALAATWIAAAPMSLALLAAVATAQRYTGDWVPPLTVAAALGLAALASLRPGPRRLAFAVLFLAAFAAAGITAAITLHYQRETLWGVPEEVRADYRDLRRRVDRRFGVDPPAARPQP